MITAGVASGTGGVPISGSRPFPTIACHMFMSPILNQAALWTMRCIIASARAAAEPRVLALLSELRARDGRCPPVAQLEKLQKHPPEQLVRPLEQPPFDHEQTERPGLSQNAIARAARLSKRTLLRPRQAVRQGVGVRDAGPELPRQGARHLLGGGGPPGGEGEGDQARGDVGKR